MKYIMNLRKLWGVVPIYRQVVLSSQQSHMVQCTFDSTYLYFQTSSLLSMEILLETLSHLLGTPFFFYVDLHNSFADLEPPSTSISQYLPFPSYFEQYLGLLELSYLPYPNTLGFCIFVHIKLHTGPFQYYCETNYCIQIPLRHYIHPMNLEILKHMLSTYLPMFEWSSLIVRQFEGEKLY